MRAHVVGWTSAGLGGLALAVAVLLPPGSPAHAERLPLEEAYDTVTVGEDVAFLDPVTLEQRTGDVRVAVEVSGDAGDVDADEGTAVRVYDTTIRAVDGTVLSPTTTTTACLDRRTAEAIDCFSEAVDGRRADVRGLTLDFPPATPEQDRMMWDGTVQASFPVRFVGSERFRGLEVQRYEQVVPEQVVRPITVPGVLVGSAEATSPADIVYSTARALLVEPVSGVVVSTKELPLTRLRGPDGTPGAVLLGGAFGMSEKSVTDALTRARESVERRNPSGERVPWAAGSVGVVLLGLGALILIRSRALAADQAEDGVVRQPVPVA
jgi:hypothetical protein